jgi:flavin prenyltransferase
MKRRLVVAITGASGTVIGIHLLKLLRSIDEVETHLIVSEAGRFTAQQEAGIKVGELKDLADVVHEPSMIGATLASGSYHHDGMLIVPCSIKTLSAVANSYSNDLISRAADVSLKEGRPLLLCVRETPFHLGHLRLMTSVSEMGAVVFPPIPAFYTSAGSVDEQLTQLCGRMLQRIGVSNSWVEVWQGPKKG